MEAGGGTFEAAFESLEGAAESGAFSLFQSAPRLFPVQLRALTPEAVLQSSRALEGEMLLVEGYIVLSGETTLSFPSFSTSDSAKLSTMTPCHAISGTLSTSVDPMTPAVMVAITNSHVLDRARSTDGIKIFAQGIWRRDDEGREVLLLNKVMIAR